MTDKEICIVSAQSYRSHDSEVCCTGTRYNRDMMVPEVEKYCSAPLDGRQYPDVLGRQRRMAQDKDSAQESSR